MQHIVIIGNGISGITCARHIRKRSDDQITVISSESKHFYSRTALMYIYMGHMKYEHTKPYEDFFWEKNKIGLLQATVTGIDAEKKNLLMADGSSLQFDKLVIATGSVTSMFDWPGQDLKSVCGLYNLQDLENIEKSTANIKNAVIVGGGLIGIELAEMLHSRGIHVTILVKDKYYWAGVLPEQDAQIIASQLSQNNIDVRYNTTLQEIHPGENGVADRVSTNNGEVIRCEFVGITTGVKPNINWLAYSTLKTRKGIVVNEFFETSCKDIYAIGDCAEFENPLPGRKAIEQVWYTGRMHGETLAQTLTGNKMPYQPGPWFNSAKFFNAEYQTYGLVPSKKEDGFNYFFWKHPSRDIAAGFCYEELSNIFHGINIYGMRMRHEFFDKKLRSAADMNSVLADLKLAMFDPEFSRHYITEIVTAWNKQTGNAVRIKSKLASMFHL